MSEVDALLKIATAIETLTSTIMIAGANILIALVMMLLFKDMGRGSDVAKKMKDKNE
jgi:hypothetical protein